MKFVTVLFFFLLSSCSTTQNLITKESDLPQYDRSEWSHWNHVKGCQNKRAYVLKKRSMVPITYTNRKDGRNCTVATGKWKDFYFDEVHTNAREVDIDHLIPLRHAHISGGANWSPKRKRKFANDPLNLVITKASYNRQKGAQTPLEWMPVDRSYACRYMRQWFDVKHKYQLSISPKKIKYYDELNCPL